MNKLINLLTVPIILSLSCCRINEKCDSEATKMYLDSQSALKNPYYQRKLNSIVYINERHDTIGLTFSDFFTWMPTKQQTSNSLDGECDDKYDTLYQIQYVNYEPRGLILFSIIHSTFGFEENKSILNNSIKVAVNGRNYIFKTSEINNPQSSFFIKSISINNRQFQNVNIAYDATDTSYGLAYYNVDYGLIQAIDNLDSSKWTLIYP